MMDKNRLEQALSELPLYIYSDIDPKSLEFAQRVRYICEHDCPMYGKSWACPPGVGSVESCKQKCERYANCLLIGTITEVPDIADTQACLATRPAHEKVTNQVRDLFREQGVEPYVLSTESCAICPKCAYPDAPCRHPDRMFPCVESYGIVATALAEQNGIEFYNGNLVTWFSVLCYR